MWWLAMGVAFAVDGDQVVARVAETAAWRAHRVAEQHAAPSEAEIRAAAAGKVITGVHAVEGHSAKLGWGVAVIDAPIERLWLTLNDETHQLAELPVSTLALIDGEPCADGRKVLMVLPLPVVSDRWWVNVNQLNPALRAASGGQMRELAWRSVADPAALPLTDALRAETAGKVPVGFNKGAWLLLSLDEGHTYVEYHSWVDPGGRLPSGAASLFATSGISDTFTTMGRLAKSGQGGCPVGT